jgi:hypothetical protein
MFMDVQCTLYKPYAIAILANKYALQKMLFKMQSHYLFCYN